MVRPTVGSKVRIARCGRHGKIIIDHGEEDDLPYKVEFDDGELPHADWFSPQHLESTAAQAAAVAAVSQQTGTDCSREVASNISPVPETTAASKAMLSPNELVPDTDRDSVWIEYR